MFESDEYPFVAGFSWANDNVFNLMCCPAVEFEGFENIGCQLEFRTIETNANDGLEYSLTTSPLRFLSNGDVIYYPINPIEHFCKNSESKSMVGPGAEAFTFSPTQKLQPIGSGVPVAVFSYIEMASPYTPDAIFPVMTVDYVGRFGEKRNMDRGLMNKTVKFNGNVVLENDGANLAEFGYSWDGGEGLFEVETSCSNLNIGNVQGKNSMTVSFDQRKADKFPPVLQMVQLRDKEGNVTDHFSKSSDAILYFAGGDFEAKESEILGSYGETLYYYDLGEVPATTVEWATNGSNDFTALTLDEPIGEYNPGFGHIWKTMLESVTETGWIDLRFTMEDAAGNRQVQTISPAFFTQGNDVGINDAVDNGTTVERVGNLLIFTGNEVATIDVYSADGKHELSVNGNSLNIEDLSNGFHIVIGGNTTVKIVK